MKRNSIPLFPIHNYFNKFQFGGTSRDVFNCAGQQLVAESDLCPKALILHTGRNTGLRELCLTRNTVKLWLVVQEEVDFLVSGSLSPLKLFLWPVGNLFCVVVVGFFGVCLLFLFLFFLSLFVDTIWSSLCNPWNLLQEAWVPLRDYSSVPERCLR